MVKTIETLEAIERLLHHHQNKQKLIHRPTKKMKMRRKKYYTLLLMLKVLELLLPMTFLMRQKIVTM